MDRRSFLKAFAVVPSAAMDAHLITFSDPQVANDGDGFTIHDDVAEKIGVTPGTKLGLYGTVLINRTGRFRRNGKTARQMKDTMKQSYAITALRLAHRGWYVIGRDSLQPDTLYMDSPIGRMAWYAIGLHPDHQLEQEELNRITVAMIPIRTDMDQEIWERIDRQDAVWTPWSTILKLVKDNE